MTRYYVHLQCQRADSNLRNVAEVGLGARNTSIVQIYDEARTVIGEIGLDSCGFNHF